MDIVNKNPVAVTTAFVMRYAKSVFVDTQKIEKIAREWARKKIKPPIWHSPFHFSSADSKSLLVYLIVLDSLNFCFWVDSTGSPQVHRRKWHYLYKSKKYSGYFGLAIALKTWFEKNPDKANFEHLSRISWKEFCEIFQGGKNLLFMKKRWEIVRSVSRVFIKKYGGDPRRFVKKAKRKFSLLVPLITKELPSFNDIAVYKGRKIFLLKRAQILAGDIWGAFGGRGIGTFDDLEYLTAFADYKLPQILQYWGVLKYSPALIGKIRNKVLIPAGSRVEIEIRTATVLAVEYLRDALRRNGIKMTAYHIDWILWNESKRIKLPLPHHLTRTIFY